MTTILMTMMTMTTMTILSPTVRARDSFRPKTFVILQSSVGTSGNFYRVDSELEATRRRLECATKCAKIDNCFFFGLNPRGACRVYDKVETWHSELYYREPLATIDIKVRAYTHHAKGFFRFRGQVHVIDNRGFNTMELAPGLDKLVKRMTYFTFDSPQVVLKLESYLRGLKNNTVVVGTTTDSLLSAKFVDYYDSLLDVGLRFRGQEIDYNVCFVWQQGSPTKTLIKMVPENKTDFYCRIRIYHSDDKDEERKLMFVDSFETFFD